MVLRSRQSIDVLPTSEPQALLSRVGPPTLGSLATLGTLKAANVAILVVVLVAGVLSRDDSPIADAAAALRPRYAMREALRSWELSRPEAARVAAMTGEIFLHRECFI